MVSAAQGDPIHIGEGHQVMSVDILEMKTDQAGSICTGPKDANSGEGPQMFVGIGREFVVVGKNAIHPDVGKVFE